MKIFLSGVDTGDGKRGIEGLLKRDMTFKYNLMSYYYVSKGAEAHAEVIRDRSELILIDSGAHSFQFGIKVEWEEYTRQYADFIRRFDRPNVLGYFEMDIENIIGYDNVKELRKILEAESDKIIPVWHPERGIQDYHDMCQKYSGKVIAIGGFKGTDIKDNQFLMFLKTARRYNCKVHCLGMTRTQVLDKVPFDFTDSSSWVQCAIYGRTFVGRQRYAKAKGERKQRQLMLNYLQGMEMQAYYHAKWRKVCND